MVSFTTVILFIFIVLIVLNLLSMIRRRQTFQRGVEWEDDYYRPARGRAVAPSSVKWRASPQQQKGAAALQDVEAALSDLQSSFDDEQSAAAESLTGSTSVDFSTLPLLQRRAAIMRHLNPRRGKTVRIKTADQRRHSGTVTAITGSQVMLRDYLDERVKGIALDQIIEITER